MKKLLLLTLAITLSFAACGEKPASAGASSGASSVAAANAEAAVAADQEEDNYGLFSDTFAEGYPLTYTPVYTTADKDNGIRQGYGSFYDKNAEVTIEYHQMSYDLYMLFKGDAPDWPDTINDEWKGYGYTAIELTELASRRTLAAGKFGEKETKVIKDDHLPRLKKLGAIVISPPNADEPLVNVPYCMLEFKKKVSLEVMSEACYEALYMQAWCQVPAENQGVLVTTPEGSITAEELSFLNPKN
ncbi:MAG: hypothetical protein RR022_07940 [Angelakisella sp.]